MKSITRIILASALMLIAVSCGNNAPRTEHVILIGLDGMSSAYFDREEMPAVSKLMDDGCWTLAKRSVFETSSAINWAAMFMGAGTELTGYTEWYSQVPELPSRVVNEHGIFPTIHYLVKSQVKDSKVGAVYEWDTIHHLVDSLACDYFEQANEEIPTDITDKAISFIKNEKPTLFTISYDHPDHEGHDEGWGSEAYHREMRFLDGEIARILTALDEAGIAENTTVIVTSDHGGIGTGHGGITPAEYETPFVIAGKGIRRGGEFTESMMQYDVAATIAGLFNISQPQVWVGRAMDQCFETTK
ncbi:MAG: alkaline phosphatase [Bacteroidales bacterium]|nr:alkaline phosphatase [Bacteroidales bacterium]